VLLEHFSIEDFKDTFPLASLGARVCYSDKSFEELLLDDPRVADKERRAEFLLSLANRKHFSIFAHSFAYKKVGEENALRIGATYFKSRYNPKYPDVIGISLRHYLEELQRIDQEQYQNAFTKLAEYDVSPYKYFNGGLVDIKNERQSIEVSLLYVNTKYDGFAVFYIDGVSRIATHQLVRHSALNFSQRSQRYVKEDDNYVVLPDSIFNDDEAEEKAIIHEKLSKFLYKDLVYNYKVKREDARYLLPAGMRTTIMVSGTLNWIYDFIEKRIDPHAQWEIRHIANTMKDLLDRKINQCYNIP
jgi:thymidylate synthase (FAD)